MLHSLDFVCCYFVKVTCHKKPMPTITLFQDEYSAFKEVHLNKAYKGGDLFYVTGPLNHSTPYKVALRAVRKNGGIGREASQVITLEEEDIGLGEGQLDKPYLIFSHKNEVFRKSIEPRELYNIPKPIHKFNEVRR